MIITTCLLIQTATNHFCLGDKDGIAVKHLKLLSGPGSGFGIDSNNKKNERFYGDKNLLEISSRDLGCLDRSVINVGSGKTITVYRYFWDNAFYDNIGWEHFGYDDDLYEGGYEQIANARYGFSQTIKDDVVTYGFGDALIYTGEVGQLMRKGLAGAVCASVSDTGKIFDGDEAVTIDALCKKSPAPYESPFLLVSHSLGSRMVYDLFTTDLTADFSKFLSESVSQSEWSVIMLANQIPLFALGRLNENKKSELSFTKNLNFIAFSEINDLFSYELVPYYEHLFFSRCGILRPESILNIRQCYQGSYTLNTAENVNLVQQSEARKKLSEELGFDVIDVRVAFAGKLGFVLPVANPNLAHTNYLLHKSVSQPFFCGIKRGKVVDCQIHNQ